MTANESVRQQIENISRDTTIDDSCTRLTGISAELSHFVESISEPRRHEQVVLTSSTPVSSIYILRFLSYQTQVVNSVRKVNDTVETIKSLIEGTSAGRSSASRAKAGSKENSDISIYFPPTTRTTRSSDTGIRKSYVEQVNDSDSDMMFGKMALNKKKIKDESDEEFGADSNYFQDDYPRNTQPNNRVRNVDSMLSYLTGSGTIDTGSQDLDSNFESEYKTVQDVLNKPRPVVSSSISTSNSKTKIRAIKHTRSQDDPDLTEVSPEVAAGKPVVVPKVIREPGATRSAFRNVEVSASAKKTPDVAASDRVISIDDENSNEAISIAETEAEARRETTASTDPHCDTFLGGGSQEETMERTGSWQAITHADHAPPFEDLDDRDVSQYQSQADLFPVPPEEQDFPSDDSEGSVSQKEADEDEGVMLPKSPEGAGSSTRSASECARRGASESKKGTSIARVFSRAGGKESPGTAAASALVQTIHTPNRNHIREEKLPTPCTAVSTATASSAEPKNKSSWPATRENSPRQPLQQQRDQVHPFRRDDGTGTQSDSEASSSRTRTFDKSKPSGGPRRNTLAAPEDEEVSRVRTGPGRAALHHHTPRQPPQPAAQMLGALGPLDLRFPPPAETSPTIRSDNTEGSQEWLDTKDRSGKRPREDSEELVEEGKGRKQKQVQSEEVSNHRAPATALPAASPAALPASRRTRQRESIELVASAPPMNDVVDLTDV